jgi:hypothetical protein
MIQMSGETNLTRLICSMQPVLAVGPYVFVTLKAAADLPSGISPLLVFREGEGFTLILRKEEADAAAISSSFPSSMITLNIHSSLDAIGFLAAVLPRLAAVGIPVNVVSAFYHDHLFVPCDRAGEALEVLQAMTLEQGAPEPES